MSLTKVLKGIARAIDGYTDMDTDHPECPQCGATMNFYGHDENGDFPLGEGYWECPGCGLKFGEEDVWKYRK